MSLYRTGLMMIAQVLVGGTDGKQSSTDQRKMWAYSTKDAAATVETAGYFDTAYDIVGKGDTIQAVMAIGGTPVLKHYVVTASSSSGVTVALAGTTAG